MRTGRVIGRPFVALAPAQGKLFTPSLSHPSLAALRAAETMPRRTSLAMTDDPDILSRRCTANVEGRRIMFLRGQSVASSPGLCS